MILLVLTVVIVVLWVDAVLLPLWNKHKLDATKIIVMFILVGLMFWVAAGAK